MKPRYLTTLLSGLLLAGCASRPPTPPAHPVPGDYSHTRAHMAWLAEKEMGKHGVVGLSISLVDGQQVVWSQGFGYADQAAKQAANGDTVYRVGSVSKLFTTIAALQLVEEGKLGLDDPLAKYLPDLSLQGDGADRITPRQLASHHAGLPRDLAAGMWGDRVEPPAALVPALAGQSMLMPPGRAYAYSNVGMSLLGEAVSRAAGRPFADLVQDRVLKPLGTDHARFSAPVPDAPWMAKSYKAGQEQRDYALRDIAAGGLVASVNDLARFMEMVFARGEAAGGRVLGAASLAEMERPQFPGPPLDLDTPTGLGWHLSHPGLEHAGRVLTHDGSTGLFHASVILLPEHKLGVAVLANSDTAAPVVGKLATETLRLALAAKTGQTMPEPARIADGPALTAEERAPYLGWWATSLGAVKVVEKGDGLRAILGGKQLRLTPRADGLLRLEYRLLGLFPVNLGELGRVGLDTRRIEGTPRLVAQVGGRMGPVGSRVEPAPIPAAWRARLGEYRLANPEGLLKDLQAVRLLEEDGLLFAEVEQQGERSRIILKPLDDSRALALGTFAEYGEMVQATGEDGCTLVYSGLRFVRQGHRGNSDV